MIMIPTKKDSVADQAQVALLQYIRKQGLKVGDALPGEHALTQQLRLSRPCLREALARMRQLGVVETARRRGMHLARPAPFAVLGTLVRGGADADTVREWCEMRLVIEVGAARLLCERLTASDLAELERCCDAEQAAIGNLDGLREADRNFHRHLFRVIGNRQLDQLQEQLLAFFDTQTYNDAFAVWRRRDLPERVDHRPLLERLAQRDAEGYSREMHQHLSVHLRPIE